MVEHSPQILASEEKATTTSKLQFVGGFVMISWLTEMVAALLWRRLWGNLIVLLEKSDTHTEKMDGGER